MSGAHVLDYPSDLAGRSWHSVLAMLSSPPLLLAVLIFAYVGLTGTDPADPGAEAAVREALPFIIAINHLILFALLVGILRRRGADLRDVGWTTTSPTNTVVREIFVGVAAAVGLYLFKELAIDSTEALLFGRSPTFNSLFAFDAASLDIPLAIAGTTLVFIEESIYRGFALPFIRAKTGTVLAVVITSAAFGLLHWGNGIEAISSTASIGILLAGVFLWRRSLIAVTVAHMLYNLAILLT